MTYVCVWIFAWSLGVWTHYLLAKRANEKFRQDLIIATAHLVKQAAQDALNRAAGGRLPDGTKYFVGETGMEIFRPQDQR